MTEKIRIAVVGAGISGLAAVKECVAAGFEVEAFDSRDEIGGAWAYQHCTPDATPSEVWSSMYQGTMLNSCRDTSSFSDFPLDPARYSDYFKHPLMLQYLNEYADHFDLRKHVRLRTKVLECTARGDGSWTVRIQEDGGRVQDKVFNAVFACTGHLSTPMVPEFKGRETFKGQFFHSHCYRTPGPFEGKRVAIIGFGSSAVDIACEIAPQAKELHMVTRRGGWVLPRYVLGKPTEAWDNRATQLWVPSSLSQWLQTKLLQLVDIPPPKELVPEHKLLEQNPTVRGDFTEKVATGLIAVQRASVDSFTETGLALSTGASLDVDIVICATGYNLFDIPYLPSDLVRNESTPQNAVDLYKLLMSPRYTNVFLLGFAEVIGPLPPTVEAQARHAVGILGGRIKRPSQDQMIRHIKKFHEFQAKHFVDSPRHSIATHAIAYNDDLLEPLGAVPTFGRLLTKVFTSNPIKAMKVLNAVWFGIPSSAQWRLCGEGKKEPLARATVLRIAAEERELSRSEREFLVTTT
ncbi:flavin monooxygenase-like protein [Diplogelasinospora grovesii]|uniref:Flavin-containing monooxygenase 1 n=1 Tax=Diplogelasinospora grovesii TaxID=303347 RepID=A0AAN6MYJ7_9PEZI|nr:flavin monooxygenase-like protein [Diplogelasinospora grovesii]